MEDVLEWFSASRAGKACLTVLLAATPHCSPTLFWQPVGQIWVMGGLTNAQALLPLGSGGIVEVTAGGHCGLRDQQRMGSLTGLCLSFLVASSCLKNSNKKRWPG